MDQFRAAFRDECARLGEVLGTLDPADLDRPTRCVPWTVAELLAHVRTGAGRLADMLAAPAPARAEVDAAGYFGMAKFTPQVDAARIEAARVEAAQVETARMEAARVETAQLETAGIEAGRVEATEVEAGRGRSGQGGRCPGAGWAPAADFDRAWRATLAAVGTHSPDRVVRTRHGDAMTVTEFLRTRVVEVGVHGLDLAAALDRPPWLTATAGRVIADLLTGGRSLPAELGWDRLTLIAKATGRIPATPAERTALAHAGLPTLSFGRHASVDHEVSGSN
ncbi:maleylpyruvate isomerase N-terminal domain-containing protein [Micromonospora sonchi]|uniref:maleylpyruvate isomerase N-terminal domain-containing protein n=1 Tax=Micromonospora sonchi TaxID=1763543 RepID=UPI00166DB219|nr:maleylpyruvate isomerase N-terminal domain-containing protein [Micromonospora sonchi]